MNNEQKNLGISWTVILIACALLFVLFIAPWIPGELFAGIHRAPTWVKLVSYACYTVAAFWLYLCHIGVIYEPTKSVAINIMIYCAGVVIPILVAIALYANFTPPLGMSTNPI